MVMVLILAPFLAVLAALSLARLMESRKAAPAIEPPRIATVEPVCAEAQPRGEGTGAFAYDNGVAIGDREDVP